MGKTVVVSTDGGGGVVPHHLQPNMTLGKPGEAPTPQYKSRQPLAIPPVVRQANLSSDLDCAFHSFPPLPHFFYLNPLL